jgi:hypothetical protein
MKHIRILAILMCCGILLNTTSCVTVRKDNGKHKGWFKNPNNPHNPAHTSKAAAKPAKAKGKK